MKIPNSVRSIYEELLPAYRELKGLVDTRFQALREPRWHYESRVKQAQSFALKLETGRVPNPKEMEERAQRVTDPERRWLVATDPEEHVRQIEPYLELGFTHLVFHSPTDDQARFLRLYSERVLPRLRERWG